MHNPSHQMRNFITAVVILGILGLIFGLPTGENFLRFILLLLAFLFAYFVVGFIKLLAEDSQWDKELNLQKKSPAGQREMVLHPALQIPHRKKRKV